MNLRGDAKWHTLDNSLWKRLWACPKTDYELNCIHLLPSYICDPCLSNFTTYSSETQDMKILSLIVQALSAAVIDPAYGRPLIDCRSDTKVKRLAFSYKPILYVVERMLSKRLLTAADV